MQCGSAMWIPEIILSDQRIKIRSRSLFFPRVRIRKGILTLLGDLTLYLNRLRLHVVICGHKQVLVPYQIHYILYN